MGARRAGDRRCSGVYPAAAIFVARPCRSTLSLDLVADLSLDLVADLPLDLVADLPLTCR
ncbi:MAG: hypothetical protein ACK53V_05905 [Planctomycetota bacterium]